MLNNQELTKILNIFLACAELEIKMNGFGIPLKQVQIQTEAILSQLQKNLSLDKSKTENIVNELISRDYIKYLYMSGHIINLTEKAISFLENQNNTITITPTINNNYGNTFNNSTLQGKNLDITGQKIINNNYNIDILIKQMEDKIELIENPIEKEKAKNWLQKLKDNSIINGIVASSIYDFFKTLTLQ